MTAVKMLSCLTKPTNGDAIVGGYSITNESVHVKRLIGVSLQETVLKRKVGKLSGGWQCRVSIAMALIGEPEILRDK